jgi:hypothetical protein
MWNKFYKLEEQKIVRTEQIICIICSVPTNMFVPSVHIICSAHINVLFCAFVRFVPHIYAHRKYNFH